MSAATLAARGPSAPVRLRRNVAAGYALQIANYLIPLITLPFLVRTLGPEQYGRMAFAYGILYFAVLFVDAGFNTRAARALASGRSDRDTASAIYAVTTWLKVALALAVLASIAGAALLGDLPRETVLLLLASFLTVLGSVAFPTWLYQGLEAMHHTALCAVAGRLAVTIALFALVRGPEDLLLAATLQAGGTLTAGLLSIPGVRRLGLTLLPDGAVLRAETRRAWRESWRLAVAEYAARVLANGGVFLLGWFVAGPALGAYAAIEKLALALTTLQRPLLRALFPRACRLWAEDRRAARRLCLGATRWLAVAAVLGSVTAAWLAPFAVERLFGAEIAAHAALLRILCCWIPAAMICELVGELWLVAPGHQDHYGRIGTFATAGQALLLFAGVSIAGAAGLCAALAVGEWLRCGALVRAALRLHAMDRRS